MFRHVLHHASLFHRKLSQTAIHAARREIRDDAVTHSRSRIEQRRHPERFENMEEDGGSRDDDFGAPRTDSGDLLTRRHIQRGNIPIEAADLRGGSTAAVGFVAPGARNPVHRAYHCRSSCRSADDTIDAGISDPPDSGTDSLLNIFAEPMEIGGSRRIGAKKQLLQPQRAERFRKCLAYALILAQDDLGAAAADVDDQEPLFRDAATGF